MKKIKNPSNRNSLPSIIISRFDDKKIYELKVKYEKLARLDKLEIEDMSLDEGSTLLFKKVKFNGIEIEIKNQKLLEFDSYIISGKKQTNTTGKTIISLLKEGKKVTYNVTKKDGKYYKNGEEFIIPQNANKLPDRLINDKFIITIEDKVRDEDTKRKKETQRDILSDDTIETYKRISSYKSIKSEDIYTIKRYITFKSDMMFFYTFVDDFFNSIKRVKRTEKRNNKEIKTYEDLWEIKFNEKNNLDKFIEFTLNDTLKNPKGILADYCSNLTTVQDDFEKINTIFSKIRHSLAHFDFVFIDKLLSNQKIEEFDFDIKFLNDVIDKTQDLYYEAKKEFIEDEKIIILDEKDIEIKKLYIFFSKIDIKQPAFNKLINSFIIKDGIENIELKTYIKEKYKSEYFIDIHANKEYKKIYNEHKKLVGENQSLQLNPKENGQKIKELNDKLEKLKTQMNTITKQNSLKRLEFKLRLAFGFIKVEYGRFDTFKNSFDEDIKKGKFKEISFEKIKSYLDKTYTKEQFFNYGFNKKTKKPNSIFDDIEGETLKELVQNDDLLKTILLFYIFTPKELKGEFLGFIKKFYHDTKNICQDTKDEEKGLENLKLETPLKLKILEKNLKKLTIFNYSISSNINFDTTNKRFYAEGNRFNRIYKKLNISHNQDEFDKSLLSPLLQYYMNLYKLIGDFEIYLLLKFDGTKYLSELINNTELASNGKYNFTTLLSKWFQFDPKRDKKYEKVLRLRNTISHQNINNMVINFEKETILSQRENIVQLIEEQNDLKEILKYDAVNDFTMKTIQLLKSIEIQSDKSKTINELLSNKDIGANDFYNIYKVKGVEMIKKELFNRLGKREIEKKIEVEIAKGAI